jgi:phosphoserine phosphatase RsbU/P
MGHGVSAALLMATARAALRASALESGALGHLMKNVNDVLTRDARHGRFMTMFIMLVDPAQGSLRWSCAGHDSPLLYDPPSDTFREFDGGDLPLGVEPATSYQEYSSNGLKPGQIIMLGTDGIWEARNDRDQLFGKANLQNLIRDNAQESCEQIAAALNRALESHFAGTPSHDDITFVLIKIT